MPLYTKQMKQKRLEKVANRLSKGEGRSTKHHLTSWAYLLKRVFDVDGYACPEAMNWCGPPFGIGFSDN